MMTGRQRQALQAIEAAIRESGRSPTVREIAVKIRAKSPGQVAALLAGLEERGFIRRARGRRRGVEVLRPSGPPIEPG